MQKAMLKVTTELRWLRRLSAVAVLVKLKPELKVGRGPARKAATPRKSPARRKTK